MIPQSPPAAQSKMVKISIESFSDDELAKRWSALENKDNWDEACEMCKMPGILHKGPCTRKEEVNAFEYGKLWEAWDLYRKRMKPIIMLKEKKGEKIKTRFFSRDGKVCDCTHNYILKFTAETDRDNTSKGK